MGKLRGPDLPERSVIKEKGAHRPPFLSVLGEWATKYLCQHCHYSNGWVKAVFKYQDGR